MPVENIHQVGTLMFNKTPEGGHLADSVYSHPGDIHEDDEFNEADLELIKNKDDSIKSQFRYLTDAQAKNKRKDRQELEDLAADADVLRDGVQPSALLDSTGEEGDVTIEEKMKAENSKTVPNKAANNKDK